jgi:hypothetical protein
MSRKKDMRLSLQNGGQVYDGRIERNFVGWRSEEGISTIGDRIGNSWDGRQERKFL